tara:strand:+ start:1893 stop:2480 length:588 start_codon:yes stop_codon:yes gene_type:complete
MIKLLLLGDTNVGKSSMVYYFSKNKMLTNPLATVGIDFVPVRNTENNVYAHVWDTGGLEKFQCITRHYYSGAQCVMIVYDASLDTGAYAQIVNWYEEIIVMCGDHSLDNIAIMIVGNKCDTLPTLHERIPEDLQPLMSRYKNMMHMYTSAKTGKNIHKAFTKLLSSARTRMNSPLLNKRTKIVLERPRQVMHCCY